MVYSYRGYTTKATYDNEDKIYYGKLEGISDLVNFHSNTKEKFEKEFHLAVDDYLIFCEEIGKNPDSPVK